MNGAKEEDSSSSWEVRQVVREAWTEKGAIDLRFLKMTRVSRETGGRGHSR